MSLSRLRFVPLIVYVLIIFWVSTRPDIHTPGPKFSVQDKLEHLAEYLVLGGLLFMGIGWMVSRVKLATFAFLLALGASIGALDEMVQSYIPGRAMDVFDWCADVVGVGASVALFVFTRLGARKSGPAGAGNSPAGGRDGGAARAVSDRGGSSGRFVP